MGRGAPISTSGRLSATVARDGLELTGAATLAGLVELRDDRIEQARDGRSASTVRLGSPSPRSTRCSHGSRRTRPAGSATWRVSPSRRSATTRTRPGRACSTSPSRVARRVCRWSAISGARRLEAHYYEDAPLVARTSVPRHEAMATRGRRRARARRLPRADGQRRRTPKPLEVDVTLRVDIYQHAATRRRRSVHRGDARSGGGPPAHAHGRDPDAQELAPRRRESPRPALHRGARRRATTARTSSARSRRRTPTAPRSCRRTPRSAGSAAGDRRGGAGQLWRERAFAGEWIEEQQGDGTWRWRRSRRRCAGDVAPPPPAVASVRRRLLAPGRGVGQSLPGAGAGAATERQAGVAVDGPIPSLSA